VLFLKKLTGLVLSSLTHFGTSTRSQSQASHTDFQSHSLSQGYRADLPTSLGHVIFSLEVSCLGDLMRLSVRRLPQSESPASSDYPPHPRRCTPTYSRSRTGF